MSNRKAVLIGVDGYGFRPLSSAVNDAVQMRTALTSCDGAQLEPVLQPENVILLASPRPGNAAPEESLPATRAAILGVLRPFYDDPNPIDFLLVFFAGHGLTVSPDGRAREMLILPADVEGPEEGRNMISLTEVLNLFTERGPRQQVWIVDACRDMAYARRPRGYSTAWPEQPPQAPRAQVALYAVAQGGSALSEAGGQGRFTGHLLQGLLGAGAATDHIPGRGHCVTVQSLHEYAKRRVAEALEGYDEWTRTVQLPQLSQIHATVEPLRRLPPPSPRPFSVTVVPPQAHSAVSVSLEVEFGLPAAGWPPAALPRLYELRATLLPGKEEEGWESPQPALCAVDLREEHSRTITVGRRAALKGAASLLAPNTNETGAGRARTIDQKLMALGKSALDEPVGVLTVAALEPLAHLRLRLAEAPWTQRKAHTNTPIALAPGCWDVSIMIGDDVMGISRVILKENESRMVEVVPQITPTTATLLPRVFASTGRVTPQSAITPWQAIGPMQGRILPTLLPLLGLKLFDTQNRVLRPQTLLDIPVLDLAEALDTPFVAALALDGVQPARQQPPRLENSSPSWIGPDSRVTLSLGGKREPGMTATVVLNGHRTNVAVPHLPGSLPVVSAIAWRDGRMELSIGYFCLPIGRLPIGTGWEGSAEPIAPETLARALALAVSLFRANTRFSSFGPGALAEVARRNWLDPVLGVIAFHAHDSRAAGSADTPSFLAPVAERETVRRMLGRHFPDLPDTRIIAALHEDARARRDALSALLDDAGLGQPILSASLAHLARAAHEAGRDSHWSVDRFDRIDPGQIFNAIRVP